MSDRTNAPVFLGKIKALWSATPVSGNPTWYPFYALSCEVSDKKTTEEITPAGHRAATGIGYGKEWSEITLQGPATYGELDTFCKTVANAPGTAGTFSIFYGTSAGGYRYDACVVTGWTIEQTETAINLTVNLVGKKGYRVDAAPTATALPDENKVLLRGRNALAVDGTPDTGVGTAITLDGNPVGDWYTWSVEVSNLAQNGYYGYAITPSFAGAGVATAQFALNWDADADNVTDSNRYTAGSWSILNVTQVDSTAYKTQIDFVAQCIEAQGYADEQELVRSYQSNHQIIEGDTNIIAITHPVTQPGGGND